MPSIRSKIIIWIIRNRHLLKFRIKPEVIDEDFDVINFRNTTEQAVARIKLPENIQIEKISVGDINAEWIIPEGETDKNKVLLYIHGGGFISGSCISHQMHVAKFAQLSNKRALLFDYRLAPEHPFPQALDDCAAVYEWLLNNGYKASDIVVGGESAGGTLTLTLLLKLKQIGLSLPAKAFSISPVTDVLCQTESFKYNASKDIAPKGSWELWNNIYRNGHDPKDPLLSPVYGDFSNMPPIHLTVGTHEIHLDDCRKMAEKIRQDGSEVIYKEWPEMIHAFPILSPLFPEAKQALDEICDFIK